FGTFWFWTIHYATQYGSRVGVGQGLQILAERFWITMGTAWPIWAMAALGLIACLLVPAVRMRAGFLVTFAFFSALAVCPGFLFRTELGRSEPDGKWDQPLSRVGEDR